MKYKKITILALITLILDQVSKLLIVNTIDLGHNITIINSFLKLTYTRNFGAAWSMLWGKQTFLIIVSLIALSFIFYLIIKEKKLNNYKNIYYGMIVGGILGNLIDRILFGYVIDFLDFTIFNYDFPVFNISDSCIVISVFLILIEAIRGELDERHNSNRRI